MIKERMYHLDLILFKEGGKWEGFFRKPYKISPKSSASDNNSNISL